MCSCIWFLNTCMMIFSCRENKIASMVNFLCFHFLSLSSTSYSILTQSFQTLLTWQLLWPESHQVFINNHSTVKWDIVGKVRTVIIVLYAENRKPVGFSDNSVRASPDSGHLRFILLFFKTASSKNKYQFTWQGYKKLNSEIIIGLCSLLWVSNFYKLPLLYISTS